MKKSWTFSRDEKFETSRSVLKSHHEHRSRVTRQNIFRHFKKYFRAFGGVSFISATIKKYQKSTA